METNYLKRYIISSYILAWSLILFVAGPASLIFHAPPVVMWLVRNLISWSPTYLLLIGWKWFRPGETRMAFVKRCFSGKIRPLMLLGAFGLVFGISVLSLGIFSLIEGLCGVSGIRCSGRWTRTLPTGGQFPILFPISWSSPHSPFL